MEQICFALPIIAGKTEDASVFMQELDGPRAADLINPNAASALQRKRGFDNTCRKVIY
jgi:hypothetical protein